MYVNTSDLIMLTMNIYFDIFLWICSSQHGVMPGCGMSNEHTVSAWRHTHTQDQHHSGLRDMLKAVAAAPSRDHLTMATTHPHILFSLAHLQIFCLSKSVAQLPLQLEDAMRPETQEVSPSLPLFPCVLRCCCSSVGNACTTCKACFIKHFL